MFDTDISSKHKFSTPHEFAITVTVDGLVENDYRDLAEDVCKLYCDGNDRKVFVAQVMRMTNELRTRLDTKIDDHFAKGSTPYKAHFAFAKDGRIVDEVL